MQTTTQGRLAADEFAFRYLFPDDARKEPWTLDATEQRYQLPSTAGDAAGVDLEPWFRPCVLGKPAQDGLRDRLLTTLLACLSPASLTPRSPYGLHGSHPSPRAYYPLQCLLLDAQRDECHWLDHRQLRLRPIAGHGLLPPPGDAGLSLWLKADFHVYHPLYNLFRKALFALEAGHFMAEILALGKAFELDLRPAIDERGIRITVHAHPAGSAGGDALTAHSRFARQRNSGRFQQGLMPASHRFDSAALGRLRDAISTALDEAAGLFPLVRQYPLSAKLCLRAGEGVAAGIYRIAPEGLQQLDPADPVDACERHFNYPNFSFATVPGLLFLCIDPTALAGPERNFIEINCALGHVAQRLIRHLDGQQLFGRPFRSYDQFGMDRLLRNSADGSKTYYGLLMGRNRSQETLGVLR